MSNPLHWTPITVLLFFLCNIFLFLLDRCSNSLPNAMVDREVLNKGRQRRWWRSKVQPSRRWTGWWSPCDKQQIKKRNTLKVPASRDPSDIFKVLKMSPWELDEWVNNRTRRWNIWLQSSNFTQALKCLYKCRALQKHFHLIQIITQRPAPLLTCLLFFP